MTETRLTELEALCAAAKEWPWTDAYADAARTALHEALAEIRRLREAVAMLRAALAWNEDGEPLSLAARNALAETEDTEASQ